MSGVSPNWAALSESIEQPRIRYVILHETWVISFYRDITSLGMMGLLIWLSRYFGFQSIVIDAFVVITVVSFALRRTFRYSQRNPSMTAIELAEWARSVTQRDEKKF